MLYIISALKPEAQAFIDKYKLLKVKYKDFYLHENEYMKVLVSGLGNNNSKIASNMIINTLKPSKDDIFLNVGICGANKQYKTGELLEVSSIVYKDKTYTLNQTKKHTIDCVDNEISTDKYNIVDMESFGFYEGTKEIKNRYMYKIVSDHFEPQKVTKEKTKSLVFNTIEEIMKKVSS
ncbi:MAG: hypothetical protein OQK48_06850 [Sulfurimonas sp.]|uniref:hypothetical protein n=1 Tax=Sulfurimonas sp. TaxID=2022749 RepID=UPI002633B108|nr:hypothetical protein [Sulfurimonas sp.]MCW8896040.1 hypothetical protein [Sulfurimonas sp.]MCW8954649.1 hypothetical protein [Sulfurimonas sp.]MCW9067457.1 hypothetical protein [Sulfurimonas sp.]